ncbi:autotransporter outer membrane beta-barrel domain-containing protein [Salmonella enterica]|nr:autotransporter outer membrane beta-barrel domain-containing protein [Salmonella enterica subsp. enterica serovar Typhimurium]ECF0162546.1 autotransporter outer membrane beta-barrel domain-containing protein [Salmonella enterica subsp. enterica serovar Litchfield]EHL2886936.1 autotransporter outer membrane beta-barrel domain-containing protein [Salmonella enterica]
MKDKKCFLCKSTIATAVAMAFSASAFATVTLNKDKPSLDNNVLVDGAAADVTGVRIDTSGSDGNLHVSFNSNQITVNSSASKLANGVIVSGDKDVVIDAAGSTITAMGSGNSAKVAMTVTSSGELTINGGHLIARNDDVSAYGIRLAGANGNIVNLNGTTINAQGNKNSLNSSNAIDNSQATGVSTVNMSGSVIEHGDINSSTYATHTMNLSLSGGSRIGSANNRQKINADSIGPTANENMNISSFNSAIYADIWGTANTKGTTSISVVLDKGSSWEGNAFLMGNSNTSMTVELKNDSSWNGFIQKGDQGNSNTTVSLHDSQWNVTGYSMLDSLAVKGGAVNVSDASIVTKSFDSQGGRLFVDATTTNALNVSGIATGEVSVINRGVLDASLLNAQNSVITLGKDSSLVAKGTTEAGLYEYDLVERSELSGNSSWYFAKSERVSNVGSIIQAMAAAPINIANLQADALSGRQDTVRLNKNDNGGIWGQYFGGKQKHTTASNASYDLNVNGVMIGGDTRVDVNSGTWLAGIAMSSVKGNISTMQSSGDIEGYSFHSYLSRQYNNGIFIDTAAQFGHYNNSGNARLANSVSNVKLAFNANGFGASLKGGYTWKGGNGLFVEPYAKLSALTLEAADYQINGINVHNDSYSSVLGETGARIGYDYTVGNTSLKPYIHFAGLNEFSDGNKVFLNNESINASNDGSAFRLGTGINAEINKNIGVYLNLNYTKGDNIENPLQGITGINVTW